MKEKGRRKYQGDNVVISVMRLTFEELLMRGFSGKSQGCEGVHNHVDP